MNKKIEFLLRHRILYDLYCACRGITHKIQGIGKSNHCVVCERCEKQGCFKNRIANKFRLARTLEARCFVPKQEGE